MMLKIKYSYQSSQILRAQNPIRYDAEIKQAHLLGEKYGQQVFAKLNHFHKHNILTQNMVGQIYRHLDSYDLDEAVRIIWLDCQSKGTDIKYLKHISPEERINYLRHIQNLAVYFGQYNKLLIPIITGETSGSAASLVCTTPFQFYESKGSIRFNDVTKGFVPHAGATYHLSRLPDELGMYYALTGRWISKDEAIELGLVYGRMQDRNQAVDYIHQNIMQYHYPTTREMYPYEVKNTREQSSTGYQEFLSKLSIEMINRTKTEDAKLVAAELLYKLKRFQEENIHKQEPNSIQQTIVNPYLHFKELNIDNFEDLKIISRLTRVTLNKPLISRCFSAGSVAEIIDRLKAEQSSFADDILKELQSQPPLSLDLAFQLIRTAEMQQWSDCLLTEHNVASNFANSGQMEKQGKVSNLDSFFDQVKPSIDYLPNALEPVKDFYKEYPDNVRFFLNERNLRQGLRERANQEIDVGAFLNNNEHSIDSSIKVSELRRMRSEIAELKRDLQLNMQRLKSLIGYEENLKKYYKERQAYLDNVKDIEQVFEQALANHFQHAYQARLNSYENVAKIAVTKSKRKLFSLVRNALLNHKLTQEDDITSIEKYQKWTKAMNRLLIFPKDDSKSFYEAQLPEFNEIVDKKCDEFEIKSKEVRAKFYEARYGDTMQEFQQQITKFYKNMIKNVTGSGKFENISEYLENKEEKEIIKQLKENNEEIILNIQSKQTSRKSPELLQKLKSGIEELKGIESLNQDLKTLISQNPKLDLLISHLSEAPEFVKPIARKFEQLLKQTYQVRAKRFNHLNDIPVIDEAINQSLALDSFQLIEDNLMFSFSYALILQLEDIFFMLRKSGSFEVQAARVELEYGIKLSNPREIEILLEYLNNSLNVATTLYNTYREKALNSSEKVLDYLVTLNADIHRGFKERAIYNNRYSCKIRDHYLKQLKALNGEWDDSSTLDEVFQAMEKTPYTRNQFSQSAFSKMRGVDKTTKEFGEVRDDMFFADEREQQTYSKLLKLKSQKSKSLVIGLHYQLKSMDLIAERQIEITPKHIQQQKVELEQLLNRKWFSHKNMDQWFQELAEETVADIYHPELFLTMQEFRQALQMNLDSEKKLLEGLRAEIIFGVQNERDEEIQKQKFQPEQPEIQNLARQLTVAETYQLQGLLSPSDEYEALYVGRRGATVKHGEDLPPPITESGYRELRTKMIGRVEHLVTEWSKVPKLIDQSDIDLLYDKIQQLQNKEK